MDQKTEQKQRVYELLSKNSILFDIANDTKENTIRKLLSVLSSTDFKGNRESICKAIMKRELLESTAIGNGIAIPHARVESINKLCIALGLSKNGIAFNSIDKKPVNIVFLVVSGNQDKIVYIRILARLARLLHNRQFISGLLKEEKPEKVIDYIKKYECF